MSACTARGPFERQAAVARIRRQSSSWTSSETSVSIVSLGIAYNLALNECWTYAFITIHIEYRPLHTSRPPAHSRQCLFDMVADIIVQFVRHHSQQRCNHNTPESSQRVGGIRSCYRIAERLHERRYGRLILD